MNNLTARQRFLAQLRDVENHYYDPYHGRYSGNGVVEMINGVRRYSDPAHRQMYPIEEMTGTFEGLRELGFRYNATLPVQQNFALFKTSEEFSFEGLEQFEALFEMMTPEHRIWRFSAYRTRPGFSSLFGYGGQMFDVRSIMNANHHWMEIPADQKTDAAWLAVFGDLYLNGGNCTL